MFVFLLFLGFVMSFHPSPFFHSIYPDFGGEEGMGGGGGVCVCVCVRVQQEKLIEVVQSSFLFQWLRHDML